MFGTATPPASTPSPPGPSRPGRARRASRRALQMAERAAQAEGLTDVDLNYPDHVDDDPAGFARRLGDLGLGVNGLAMRYYTNPAFKLGAFTNPDPAVRREAIDLTKRGHRRGARDGVVADDDLARAGRLRLQLPGRLRASSGTTRSRPSARSPSTIPSA